MRPAALQQDAPNSQHHSRLCQKEGLNTPSRTRVMPISRPSISRIRHKGEERESAARHHAVCGGLLQRGPCYAWGRTLEPWLALPAVPSHWPLQSLQDLQDENLSQLAELRFYSGSRDGSLTALGLCLDVYLLCMRSLAHSLLTEV